MPSPFPGMDPYLESLAIWPDVHHGLISQSQAALNPHLRPRYVARVELRVYISDDDDPGRQALVPDLRVGQSPGRRGAKKKPEPALAATEPLIVPTLMDEEIEEAFLKIIHVESEELVTLIEVLSPTNKIRGSQGRKSFMEKRREILNTEVNWVEIDLLRAGVPSVTDPPLRPSDYRILISRADQRTRTRFWPVGVRQPLPVIRIPLRGKDAEVPLDLGAVFRTVYDRAAYDMSVDYRKPPQPPLEGDDAKWARELLRGRGGR
ncbi:MAG TPA: DUF4058 family protein [Gemmataceae bacterium]|nr:DUF4058 family protein [Gemmataceae bacterium]